MQLVKQRFPHNDAVEKILDWVEELSETRVLGSNEPNALGINGFGHEHTFVLEHQLRGLTDEEIRKILATESESFAASLENRLEDVRRSLQGSMLKAIFD